MGKKFEAVATISGSFPSGTAADDHEVMYVRLGVIANAGLGLADRPGLTVVPGGASLASTIYEFKLVKELGTPPAPTSGKAGKITGTPSLTNPFPITITFAEAGVMLKETDISVTGGGALVANSLYDATAAGVTDMTVYMATVQPYPNAVQAFDHITVTLKTTATVKPAAGDDGMLMVRKKDGTLNSITVPAASNNAKFVVTLTFAAGLPMDVNVVAADLKLTPAGAMVGNIANNLARTVWEVEITPVMAMATTVELSDAGKMKFDTGNDYAMKTVPATADTGTTTDMIASKGYLVLVPLNHDTSALPEAIDIYTVANMLNLSEFFSTGGTIDVAVADGAKHDVIITEIMVAKDLGKRGQATGSARPEATQWIEIYNNTDAAISIDDITVTFTPGFPAADAPDNATDRLSNVVSGSGWGLVAAFPGAVSGQTQTSTNAAGTP